MGCYCPGFNSVQLLSRVRLFATPWTAAYQVPPSMGFSRQENWSGLPFPSPGDLPDPGIEHKCCANKFWGTCEVSDSLCKAETHISSPTEMCVGVHRGTSARVCV